MALSQQLASQLAKAINNEEKESKTATVKATYKNIGGVDYVQLDGSDILTPVDLLVEAEDGERVTVEIGDHDATVTGNISSPMARSKSVSDLKEEVDEHGNTIQQMDNTIIQQGNSIIQMNNAINQQNNVINQHETKINQYGDEITSINNTIIQQGNHLELIDNNITAQGNLIDSMNNTITQHGDHITSMNNVIEQHDNRITQNSNTITQQGNTITQQGNKIQQMDNTITQQGNTIVEQGNSITQVGNRIDNIDNTIIQINNDMLITDSNIKIINSAFVIEDGVMKGLSKIITDALRANVLDVDFAKIDFANIKMAAVEKLFSESGIIKDLVVKGQQVTGELVGVTIKGDLIEAGTLVADKLVIKGEDGLYYKLNTQGESVTSKQTEYNSLNGSVITAKSVTAEKVAVTDLVAFGATIGGFVIGDDSIHTTTKGTINTDADGLYMDKKGQIYFGNAVNGLKYYYDESDKKWKLRVKTDEFIISSSNKTITQTLDDIDIGGRNYIRNTSGEWSDWITPGEGTNKTYTFHDLDLSLMNLKAGDDLTFQLELETSGFTQITQLYAQGAVNGVWSGDGFFTNPYSRTFYITDIKDLNKKEYYIKTFTIPQSTIDVIKQYGGKINLGIRCDGANAEAKYRFRYFKAEKGNKVTDWTPAPEDDIDSIGDIHETLNQQNDTNNDIYKQIEETNSYIEEKSNEINSFVGSVQTELINNIDGVSSDLVNATTDLLAAIKSNTTLIQQLATSVITTIKSTGGSNLLQNSVGFSGTDFWTSTGKIDTNHDDIMSISGSEFILTGNATLSQSFNTLPGLEYSVSCRIKHKAVGTAETVKIEIIGGSQTITVLNTTKAYNDWEFVTLEEPYIATIANPTIRITCSGDDILEITDLIIAHGDNQVWSGYIDEVYGREHLLDEKGLRLRNLANNDSSNLTSTSLQMKDGDTVTAELSRNLAKSDNAEFTNSMRIRYLNTVALNDDNVIEYIEEV